MLDIDIALELGVESVAPLIESATAAVGQVVDQRRLEDLPIPSSADMYLTQLVPGVVRTTPPSGNWQINQPGNMSDLSTDGTRTQTSTYTLNGVPNLRQYGTLSCQPMPEVLREFRVQTAPSDASADRFTGSLVNIVTKSGTNNLHATRTGPLTPDKISAAFPNTTRNRYRGGPVYIPKLLNGRNRVFFTFGADLFSRAFVPAVTSKTVATLAEREGDFPALLKIGAQPDPTGPNRETWGSSESGRHLLPSPGSRSGGKQRRLVRPAQTPGSWERLAPRPVPRLWFGSQATPDPAGPKT